MLSRIHIRLWLVLVVHGSMSVRLRQSVGAWFLNGRARFATSWTSFRYAVKGLGGSFFQEKLENRSVTLPETLSPVSAT